MKTLKYYSSVGVMSLKLVLQGQMEYPSFLIGWIFCNLFQFGIGIITLKIITDIFHSINGWTFYEIAFLYGLGIISHGLAVVLYIQTWGLERSIRHGEIDRMMLRPLSVYFQFLVEYINLIGLSDLFPGIIIFVYASINLQISSNFFSIATIIIVIIGATLIRGAIYTILGSVAFWTQSSYELIGMSSSFMDKAIMYPMTIYGKTLQALLTFIIPFGFISFMPASYILNKDTGFMLFGNVALWTLVVGIVFFSLGMFIFNRGLKIYESAGN